MAEHLLAARPGKHYEILDLVGSGARSIEPVFHSEAYLMPTRTSLRRNDVVRNQGAPVLWTAIVPLFLSLLVPSLPASADPPCINWSPILLLDRRYNHAMTFDSGRAVTVLFGGYGANDFGDTWERNGTNWIQRFPLSSPQPRSGHAIAYDSARGVSVLFGGRQFIGGINLGDTWEWDGTNWTQRFPAVSPPARRYHAMAYDSGRGVTLLFGGDNGTNLSDTWEWNGSTWTMRSGAPGRYWHAMAYDSARGMTMLFGGYTSGGSLNDTWEWNGTSWIQRTPTTVPQRRFATTLAYDAVRGVTVMIGGQSSVAPLYLNDTWEWNGTNWTQRSSPTNPDVRYSHSMTFDSARGVSIMFGGHDSTVNLYGDTWTWNGSSWTLANPEMSPSPRYGQQMVYDSARGVSILFGGYNHLSNAFGDTWEWSGASWSKRSNSGRGPTYWHAMAYDAGRGKTVLFGGYNGGVNAQTWEWDGSNWTRLFPPVSPVARAGHSMAYDSGRALTVMFGGFNNSGGIIGNFTWEWDGTNWLQRSTATFPGQRYSSSMCYDPIRGVTVLFGGVNLADTWEWDGTQWTQRFPASSPSFRSDHVLVFDTRRGVSVLFGGQYYDSGPHYLNEVWEWNGINWTQRNEATNPTPRYDHGGAYDSVRNKVVVFGGSGANSEVSDTWELGGPLPDADLDASSSANGMDISSFESAILTGSTIGADLAHADFNCNGVIDEGDIPGFTQKLLAP